MEDNLHLLQTAIILLFYCSLGGAHLAGTLMLWNLWPEVEQSSTDSPNGHPGNHDRNTESTGGQSEDPAEEHENRGEQLENLSGRQPENPGEQSENSSGRPQNAGGQPDNTE